MRLNRKWIESLYTQYEEYLETISEEIALPTFEEFEMFKIEEALKDYEPIYEGEYA
jgi:hypothetical protein